MAANDIFPSFVECSRQAREIERKLLPVKPSQISGKLRPEGSTQIFPREFEEYTVAYLVSEAQKVERKLFAANYQSAPNVSVAQASSKVELGQKVADELGQFASGAAQQPGYQTTPKVPGIPAKKDAIWGGAGAQAQPEGPSSGDEKISPPALPYQQGIPSEVRIAKEAELEAEAKMANESAHHPAQFGGYGSGEPGDASRKLRLQDQPSSSGLMSSSKLSPRLRAIIEEKLRKEEQAAQDAPVEIEKASYEKEEQEEKNEEPPVLSSRERLLRKLQRERQIREGEALLQGQERQPAKVLPRKLQEPAAGDEELPEQEEQGQQPEQEGRENQQEEQEVSGQAEGAEEETPSQVEQPLEVASAKASAPAKSSILQKQPLAYGQVAQKGASALPPSSLSSGRILIKPIFAGQENEQDENQGARDDGAEKRMERISRIVRELSPDRYKAQAIAKKPDASSEKGDAKPGEPAAPLRMEKRPTAKPVLKKKAKIQVNEQQPWEEAQEEQQEPPSDAEGPQGQENPQEEAQEESEVRQRLGWNQPQAKKKLAPKVSGKRQGELANAKRKNLPAGAQQQKKAGKAQKSLPAAKEPSGGKIRSQDQGGFPKKQQVALQKQSKSPQTARARQAASPSKEVFQSKSPPMQSAKRQLPQPQKSVAYAQRGTPVQYQDERRPAASSSQPLPSRQVAPAANKPPTVSRPSVAASARPVSRLSPYSAPPARPASGPSLGRPIMRQVQAPTAYRTSPQPIPRAGSRPRILPGGAQQMAPQTYLPPRRTIIRPQALGQESLAVGQPEEDSQPMRETGGLPKRRAAYPQPGSGEALLQGQERQPARVLPRKLQEPAAGDEELPEQEEQGQQPEQEGRENQQEEQEVSGQAEGVKEETPSQVEQPLEVASAKARLSAISQVSGLKPRKNVLDEPVQKTPEQLEEEKRISQKAQVLSQMEGQKQHEISGSASLPLEEEDLEVPKPPPDDSESGQPDYDTAKYGLRRKMQEDDIRAKTKEEVEAIMEGYAKDNLVWLYEIYSMGGMPREDFLQKVKEKMAEEKIALPQVGGEEPPPPSNPALANLGKEIDKRYKK